MLNWWQFGPQNFNSSLGVDLMRRRDVIFSLSSGAAALLSGSTALARSTCAYEQARFTDQFYKRIVATPQNTYSTYPHANGFMPDGRLVVAKRVGDRTTRYYAVDLNVGSGALTPIAEIANARMYYAISRNGLLVTATFQGATIVDLNNSGKTILEWIDPDYQSNQASSMNTVRFNQDIEISLNGDRVLLTRVEYNNGVHSSSSILLLDPFRGLSTTVIDSRENREVQTASGLDHAHFSPHDQQWICFSDATPRSLRRIWVWHPTHARQPRPLADQINAERPLLLTHERAMYNRHSLLAVVYGSNSPRGLYEIPFSGEEARLVSESNRDLHCNSSWDGRWYVVSLQGTADWDRRVLDLCKRPGGASDPDWLRSDKGFSFSDIVLINPKRGTRAFLYRGANANDAQPYEAHPVISPDGRWIVIKDARHRNVLGLEVNQDMLERFLNN